MLELISSYQGHSLCAKEDGASKLEEHPYLYSLGDFKSDEYTVRVTEIVQEARKLLEAGFEYVTDMNGFKIFQKRR